MVEVWPIDLKVQGSTPIDDVITLVTRTCEKTVHACIFTHIINSSYVHGGTGNLRGYVRV